MHEDSPLLSFKETELYYKEMENNILGWIKKIQNLLWAHLIKLEDKDTIFYVSIDRKLSDSPYGNIFEAVKSAE